MSTISLSLPLPVSGLMHFKGALSCHLPIQCSQSNIEVPVHSPVTLRRTKASQLLAPCRNKHQKHQQYPLNRDGFDLITADLKLMCDNCRTYNTGNQDLEESANLMWSEATKQLEVHYQKALSEIASLMSGQRAR